jgi:hypothetical protein
MESTPIDAESPSSLAGPYSALLRAATHGTASEVEAALGRHRGDAADAAIAAAAAALAARQWDNLAYLADFLADITAEHPPLGGGEDEADDDGAGDDDSACGCSVSVTGTATGSLAIPIAVLEKGVFDCVVEVTGRRPDEITPQEVPRDDLRKIIGCVEDNILAYAVEVESQTDEGESGSATTGGARTRRVFLISAGALEDEIADTEPRASQADVVAEFSVVDPEAPRGDHRSAEDPSPYVSIEDPADDIALMQGADEKVVDRGSIRVLYSYPFGTAGPSAEEQKAGGWIFEEAAPDGAAFTRADLARAVSARYNKIYDEEEATSDVEPQYIPGMLNRAPTNGKYKIWGHVLGDLLLHTVSHDPAADLYILGIES